MRGIFVVYQNFSSHHRWRHAPHYSQSSEKGWSSAGYSRALCSGADAVSGNIAEHPAEMIPRRPSDGAGD